MKRITLLVVSVVLVAVLVLGVLPAMAAKPPRVITVSNGFPSGMHFNLNIHGKNPETFTTPDTWDPTGNSIFIPEFTADYEPITIEVISNKKGGTDFEVTDPYAMPTLWAAVDENLPIATGYDNADDLAQFILPYKIQTDPDNGATINANGYYVYGRILGKPNNGRNNGDPLPSSIVVNPNPLLQVDYEGAVFPLGLVTTRGSYLIGEDGETFIRFDDAPSTTNGKGKGKSVAKNITDMFMWSGWVGDRSLDTSGPDGIPDGVIDGDDIPVDAYTTNPEWDTSGDEVIDLDEWLTAMSLLDPSLARYYEDWWVFDIAEMVTQSWRIENDGTKLLQIRFYPVATTTFTEKAHIVVNKVTDPLGDTATLFDFDASYRTSWQMTSDQFSLSHGLDAGSYTVTELAEDGWDLTGIIIEDPTGGSTYDGSTVTIDLAEGETVTITFINTQRGRIIVIKETVGGDGSFEFDPSWSETNFSLSNGQTNESDWLPPYITYDVTEQTPPAGWNLTSITITGDDDYTSGNVGTGTATVDLDPGETITITFTNELTLIVP